MSTLDGTEQWLCRYCGRAIPGVVSSQPCPGSPDFQHRRGERWFAPSNEPEYPANALDFDLAEALGLDGTGRDDHPHAPYQWSDPWVQAYVRDWVLAHQSPF